MNPLKQQHKKKAIINDLNDRFSQAGINRLYKTKLKKIYQIVTATDVEMWVTPNMNSLIQGTKLEFGVIHISTSEKNKIPIGI